MKIKQKIFESKKPLKGRKWLLIESIRKKCPSSKILFVLVSLFCVDLFVTRLSFKTNLLEEGERAAVAASAAAPTTVVDFFFPFCP